MPSFQKDAFRTPFGRNNFLRSTRDVKTESYTVAAASVTAVTIDGSSQKVLQPGTVMAKILTGDDAGKIGPFQRGTGAAGAAGVNEVQTLTVDATGGTYTLSFGGSTTAAIAEAATAAAVLAALEQIPPFNPGDLTVTGSAGGPYTITFIGQYAATNVALITTDAALLTGGAGTAVVVETTAGSAAGAQVGAPTDGRANPANIVGICNTFLPWQLLDRDVEIAVVYECTAVQAWCFEMEASGVAIALTNFTADAMRGVKGMDIHFK